MENDYGRAPGSHPAHVQLAVVGLDNSRQRAALSKRCEIASCQEGSDHQEFGRQASESLAGSDSGWRGTLMLPCRAIVALVPVTLYVRPSLDATWPRKQSRRFAGSRDLRESRKPLPLPPLLGGEGESRYSLAFDQEAASFLPLPRTMVCLIGNLSPCPLSSEARGSRDIALLLIRKQRLFSPCLERWYA